MARINPFGLGQILAILAVFFLTPSAAQTAKQPIPFPSGYRFPANSTELAAMVRYRSWPALRQHGWNLWAGLNQPGTQGWPIWRSWNIATQAFKQATLAGAQRGAQSASKGTSLGQINLKKNPNINLSIPFYLVPGPVAAKYNIKDLNAADLGDGDNFQNNGDLMLVSEAYSQPAYDWIRSAKLYDPKTLYDLHAQGAKDVPQFPATSIVLKHMYWPVAKDRLTTVPVANMALYHQPAADPGTYIGFETQTRWTNAVAIDPSGRAIPVGETRSVTYLYDVWPGGTGTAVLPSPTPQLGPITYPFAKVVPLSDFYYKKLSKAEFDALSTNDKILIDASFYWVHQRMFEDGDYLVSIASHVVTKEIQDWTLQTLWWTDKPDETEYAADRPALPDAKGPWRHYLLNVEDGVPAERGGTTLPITYNPYIELASHPVTTNCRNCHIRAASPNGTYMQPWGPPTALDDIKTSDPIFFDDVRTDFL